MVEWTEARKGQKCRHTGCTARAVVTQGMAGKCNEHKPSVTEDPSIHVYEDGPLPPSLVPILRAAETRLACEAARRRGRMFLADAATDPATARQVIVEMVALLEHAPPPVQAIDLRRKDSVAV